MYYRGILRAIGNFKINIVIKILIVSDFLVWSSYNLLAPVFAIFITDKIQDAGIETVGIAAALYFFSKSVAEIPVGIYIDKKKGEKDDLYTAIIGTIFCAVGYFLYIFVSQIWQLYALQIFIGITNALAFPGWYSIFTRHVDENKSGFEWSLYDVLMGLGIAGSAALGGFLAEKFGFNLLFELVAIFTFIGAILLFLIRKKVYRS
ncbi:MFS transporter [Patescibacteria group bacterium]|nr:MFS transporter [Patescibacteria group bacterium]